MAAELYHGDPLMIDYTPSAAVTAGDMVAMSSAVLVAHRDIAANELGAMAYPSGTAVYKITLATGASFSAGAPVTVDLATGEAEAGLGTGPQFGKCVKAADQSAGDTYVNVVHE
jgi:predicted RecA/RadA family phage recombinase